jgi:non-ribosomal peptide synthetase component F
LTGALGLALGKYCQSNDVVLTLVTNGRFANAAFKSTLGLFLDHIPIRLRWEQSQSLSDYFKATDDSLTKILSHQACSGREWMKAALPEYDPDFLPTVAMNYRRELSLPAFQGLQAEPFPIPLTGPPQVFFSMMSILHQTAASLNVSFLYPTYYFDTDTAEGMNQDFARTLRKIAEGNDIIIADL